MNENDYILYQDKGTKVVPLSSVIDILSQIDPLILQKKITAIVNSNDGVLVIYTEDGDIYHNNDGVWKNRDESVERALKFREIIRNKIDELERALDLRRNYCGFVRYWTPTEYEERVFELEKLLHASREYF